MPVPALTAARPVLVIVTLPALATVEMPFPPLTPKT